jgi:hypothetical protein
VSKSELVFGSDLATPEELVTKAHGSGPVGGPAFVKVGSGGVLVRRRDGKIIGPIGGELLRVALANGGTKLGKEARPETFQKHVNEHGQHDGR